MQLKPFYLLVFSCFIILSCKQKQTETDNLFKYRDYISYTTSGRISVADKINVSFAKNISDWTADQTLDREFFKINPHVQGELKAVNNHAFTFIPDENLKPNTEYQVTLNLEKLYNDLPDGFDNYTFNFKTITPNFIVETNSIQSYSRELQYVNGILKSADVITIDKAKQLITTQQTIYL